LLISLHNAQHTAENVVHFSQLLRKSGRGGRRRININFFFFFFFRLIGLLLPTRFRLLGRRFGGPPPLGASFFFFFFRLIGLLLLPTLCRLLGRRFGGLALSRFRDESEQPSWNVTHYKVKCEASSPSEH
jgi:hypothetical protein